MQAMLEEKLRELEALLGPKLLKTLLAEARRQETLSLKESASWKTAYKQQPATSVDAGFLRFLTGGKQDG